MKKLLLLSFLSFLFLTNTQAQLGSCQPDLMFADSSFGVYPPPLNANNPDGGIPTTACKDQPYFFTWTLKVPETINIGFDVTIDSIVVPTTGAVLNLPAGMDYAMNPEGGVFTPEDSLACITIFGSPEVEGDFDLKIAITIYSSFGPYTDNLPSDVIPDADGNYILTVEPTNSPTCFLAAADDLLAEKFSLKNSPNPFSDFTNIQISATQNDDLTFRVFDLVGNEIHQEQLRVVEGKNTFEFDASALSNGIYIYSIGKDGAMISDKMILNR